MVINVRKLKEILNQYEDKMAVDIVVNQALGEQDDYETIDHHLNIKKITFEHNCVRIETNDITE